MPISKFEAARRASGINDLECMEICGFTRPTMKERNSNPGMWRLGELRAVLESLSDVGKPILIDAITEYLHENG